ncbi:MAG: SpoIIE family protein phosphatase [Syntrophobacteraceae bacterium]|jgi:serine phosphatase RsbU (regulator of sigma subunit)|nr:SpoIIE family protein phosphatase [Syntrophobacteraceae bacterium]
MSGVCCRLGLAGALFLVAGLACLVLAVTGYRAERTFRNPVAYTLTDHALYVLEKEKNTLLVLRPSPGDRGLEAVGSHAIERDDDSRYYMVRKLYPGPEGIVVQSNIYALQTREFLGYRYSLYKSPDQPPEVLLTIIFRNPQQYPEITYAFDSHGSHYFANNIRYQLNIWKVPPSTQVRIDSGRLPEQVQALGERNDPLDHWEAITVGPDGKIYVSSGVSGRIVEYAPSGERIREIGAVGFDSGKLLAPDEVFFARTSRHAPRLLTVASKGNRTWVQFDETGSVREVLNPLDMDYPFSDVLIGPFHYDPAVGELCSFDLANRAFLTFGPKAEAIRSYSIRLPARTASWIACSLTLFLLAFFAGRLCRPCRNLRVPFFFKLSIPLIVMVVLTARLVGDGVHGIMSAEVMAESLRRSANLAQAVLQNISLTDLKAIQKPEDRESAIYENVHRTISRILDGKQVEQTPKWILHKIQDGHFYYGINIWRGAIFMPCIVPVDRRMFWQALREKRPQHGFYTDDEGEWLSHLTPVLDETGEVINVLELYRPAEEVRRASRHVSRRVSQVVGVTVAATLVLVMAFSYVFARPLRRLRLQTEMVSRGDFEHLIDVRSRDELGDLARAFNRMVGDLKNYTGEVARAAAEKESLAGELRLARQLQQEMLPQCFPPFAQAPHVCMFAQMEPAKEVGGDYYDFFLVDDDHMAVVVADVSGKGIPAGLFMMRVRAMLRGTVTSSLSPADTLIRINQIIASENPSAMFVTMFFFICNMKSGQVTYCNAGQNPPLRISRGEVITVGADSQNGRGLPIGIMEDAVYTDGAFRLEPEDILVVYTDGVTESFNSRSELFSEARLTATIKESSGQDPKSICLNVLREVREHQGDAQQADDITILSFRLSAAAGCHEFSAQSEDQAHRDPVAPFLHQTDGANRSPEGDHRSVAGSQPPTPRLKRETEELHRFS